MTSSLTVEGKYASLMYSFLNEDEAKHIIEDDLSIDELDGMLKTGEQGLWEGAVYLDGDCIKTFDVDDLDENSGKIYTVGDRSYWILLSIEYGAEKFLPFTLKDNFDEDKLFLIYHIENLNGFLFHYIVPSYGFKEFNLDLRYREHTNYFLVAPDGTLYEVDV